MEGHLRLHFTLDALEAAGYSHAHPNLADTILHPLRITSNLNADRHLMFLPDDSSRAEARLDLGIDTSERPFRFQDEAWMSTLPFLRARLRVWTSDPNNRLLSGIWTPSAPYTSFILPDPSKFDPTRKRIEIRWDGQHSASEDVISGLRTELFAILEGRSRPPSAPVTLLARLMGLRGAREGRWVI